MLWFLFIILVVAAIVAANYEKKEPVIIPGDTRTTVKPQIIGCLVIAAILVFCLASCGPSTETKPQENAKPLRTHMGK